MKKLNELYFKTTVSTPFGLFEVVVLEQTAENAKRQARSVVAEDMNIHAGLVQISGGATRCNGHDGMFPVRGASFNGEQWAWCKRT